MAGPQHPGPVPKKDRSAQLQVLEKRQQVLDLWRQGNTYGAISYFTGYSIWSVGEIVRGALAALRANTLEEHRDRHYARLEELYKGVFPALYNDCPMREDVMMALSILDRESRLLGLDAPKRTATIAIPTSEDELMALAQALVALVKRRESADSGVPSEPELPPESPSDDVLSWRDVGSSGQEQPALVEAVPDPVILSVKSKEPVSSPVKSTEMREESRAMTSESPIAAERVARLAAFIEKTTAIGVEENVKPPLPPGMTERVNVNAGAYTVGQAGPNGQGMWSMVVEHPREDE